MHLRFWPSSHFLLASQAQVKCTYTRHSVSKVLRKRSPCPPPELSCAPGSCFPALKTFPRADKTTERVCGLMGNNSYCIRDD